MFFWEDPIASSALPAYSGAARARPALPVD
jgi:hypothetical protein